MPLLRKLLSPGKNQIFNQDATDITLGGETESETSLDKIEPTIASDTHSAVINKVKAAPTIEQAHASLNLGMSFNTTPETDILTPEQSPLTIYCRNVHYEEEEDR